MYKIKFTSEHYVGTQRPIRLGLPIYPHTTPDVCFVSPNNSDAVVLNSFILRDALLNSADFLASLGLKVIDLTTEPKQETPKVQKEPKPEPEEKPETVKKTSKKKTEEVEDTWE
jgi:hypothetical protein